MAICSRDYVTQIAAKNKNFVNFQNVSYLCDLAAAHIPDQHGWVRYPSLWQRWRQRHGQVIIDPLVLDELIDSVDIGVRLAEQELQAAVLGLLHQLVVGLHVVLLQSLKAPHFRTVLVLLLLEILILYEQLHLLHHFRPI